MYKKYTTMRNLYDNYRPIGSEASMNGKVTTPNERRKLNQNFINMM